MESFEKSKRHANSVLASDKRLRIARRKKQKSRPSFWSETLHLHQSCCRNWLLTCAEDEKREFCSKPYSCHDGRRALDYSFWYKVKWPSDRKQWWGCQCWPHQRSPNRRLVTPPRSEVCRAQCLTFLSSKNHRINVNVCTYIHVPLTHQSLSHLQGFLSLSRALVSCNSRYQELDKSWEYRHLNA